MTLLITLNGGIKLKRNEIHELNIIFLLSVIERFSSAIEYYFNMVGLESKLIVECLKKLDEEIGEKNRSLNSKIISGDFNWQKAIAKGI